MQKRKVVISEELDDSEDTSPGTFNDILIDSLKSEIGGSVYILGKDDSPTDVKEWLSTGSTVLDMSISNNPEASGGIPVGRLTEISGDPSTGKSLLAYMILKDCAAKGGVSVLIDTENAANINFLRMLGLEPEKNLIYTQADTVEDVFNMIETIIKQVRTNDKNKLLTIVWDSVAQTSTRKEMEGDTGDATVGLVARLIGQGLRKIIRMIGDQRIALVFLNQLRDKIGVIFGDPKTTPGGNAIPFAADVRIRLYTAGKITAGKDVLGVGTRAKVMKTRFGPPFREASLNIYFDKGLIDEEGWFEYLKSKKLVTKISAQKSSIEYNGKTFEFKNKDFNSFIRSKKELKEHFVGLIKKDMYIEQDPEKRDEEIVLEKYEGDEV